MKKSLLLSVGLAVLVPAVLGSPQPASVQAQSVSVVALLEFQDDTGTNVSAEKIKTLTAALHQNIATRYKDLLPRLVSGSDAATQASTLAQIAALARQNGARYIVRAGLLALNCAASGSSNKVVAQLYADIIFAEDGTVLSSVRAEGSGTEEGAQPPSASGLNSCSVSSQTTEQAFAGALGQLADSIHQTVVGGTANGSTAGNSVQTPPPSPLDAAQSAAQDADLQQLIAQTETLLSSNVNLNSPAVTAAGQALQALKSALQTKATLMQNGQDPSQADQDIAAQRQSLQSAVAQITADAAAASSTGTVTASPQQTGGQEKGFLQTINDFASQSLSLLQNIQQMRSTLQNLTEPSPVVQPGDNPSPAAQPVGECNGVVRDQSGNAIPNAQVAEQLSGASTVTDSNGQYDLRGLVVNQIATLTVTAEGKSMTAQSVIIAGQLATLDFQFKPDSATGGHPVILPPTVVVNASVGSKVGALKGVVRDPQGLPVPRALVSLKNLGFARTDSRGEYQFLNVPAGKQILQVNESSYQPTTKEVTVAAGASTQLPVRFAVVDRMNPGADTSLTVSASGATLTGLVVDRQNHALAGARITLLQQASALAILTGPNGAFVLSNVRPGQYRIVASRAGYEPVSQNMTLSSRASSSVQFRLDQQNSPLVANLLKARAPRTCLIRGRVVATGGRALAHATVILKPANGDFGAMSVNTDEDGDYQLTAGPGTYEIRAHANSYQPASHFLEVKAGAISQFDFALQPLAAESSGNSSGRTFLIPEKLAPAGNLVGQLTDANTKRPVTGAIVLISGSKQTRTDENGRFNLANLSPGRYQLTISHPGYSSLQGAISIQSGKTAFANLSLQRSNGTIKPK